MLPVTFLLYKIFSSIRVNWQKVQAVVLLAEHVVVNITYTDLYVFLKRYNNVSLQLHHFHKHFHFFVIKN